MMAPLDRRYWSAALTSPSSVIRAIRRISDAPEVSNPTTGSINRFVDTHSPYGRAFTLFAPVYIDRGERSRRRRLRPSASLRTRMPKSTGDHVS